MGFPTDAEIQAVGQHLGHGPGPYSTKLRAQIAKTIQTAGTMEIQARKDDAVTGTFGDRIASIYTDLTSKLPAEVAGAVTAAVSAQVYRETQQQETA